MLKQSVTAAQVEKSHKVSEITLNSQIHSNIYLKLGNLAVDKFKNQWALEHLGEQTAFKKLISLKL